MRTRGTFFGLEQGGGLLAMGFANNSGFEIPDFIEDRRGIGRGPDLWQMANLRMAEGRDLTGDSDQSRCGLGGGVVEVDFFDEADGKLIVFSISLCKFESICAVILACYN